MAPSTGHVVQRHGAKLLKGNPHPVRSGNEMFLHASAFKATTDP